MHSFWCNIIRKTMQMKSPWFSEKNGNELMNFLNFIFPKIMQEYDCYQTRRQNIRVERRRRVKDVVEINGWVYRFLFSLEPCFHEIIQCFACLFSKTSWIFNLIWYSSILYSWLNMRLNISWKYLHAGLFDCFYEFDYLLL